VEWQDTSLWPLCTHRRHEQDLKQALHKERNCPRNRDGDIVIDEGSVLSWTVFNLQFLWELGNTLDSLVSFFHYQKHGCLPQGSLCPIMMPGQGGWCSGKNVDSALVWRSISLISRVLICKMGWHIPHKCLAQSRCWSDPENSVKEITENGA
jgi:hypothetical protein